MQIGRDFWRSQFSNGGACQVMKRTLRQMCFALLASWLWLVICFGRQAGPPFSLTDHRPNILLLLADDWSFPHAGSYSDRLVKTPNFDRIAREGALFTNAFCVAPSCTASRAAILTGQAVHRLEDGGNLWGTLPQKFTVYSDVLEAEGYFVGFSGKGWGPGNYQAGGRARNPAGTEFASFTEFYEKTPKGKPFCFWFGNTDPHRPYEKGIGLKAGMRLDDVVVPPYWPDTPEVRADLLDYYWLVERFDRDIGEILKRLEDDGQLDRTFVVVTSDNGLPFPRAKANLYDAGTRMPLAVRWPAKVRRGMTIDDFVSHADFAPTFLEAAGIKPSTMPAMTGRSLLPLLNGKKQSGREKVFVERERHANVRQGDLSYPSRAIRTKDYLYIRNLRPERWPAGDPEMYFAVGSFGDIDNSPSKQFLLQHRGETGVAKFFSLACDRRPAEELYDLRKDPAQTSNVAERAGYAAARMRLRAALDKWMRETGDPRSTGSDELWDRYRYFGRGGEAPVSKP
jgi:N-sulfoglucosamine sulfohydrolase